MVCDTRSLATRSSTAVSDGNFDELEPTDVNDVFAICSANGVTDKKDIDKVIKEASTCDFDLRRVRKSIHKVKRMVGE